MRISEFMPESRQIWLVRHGETEWSRSGQHTGRTDLPLTARGLDEARFAAGFLNGRPFQAVLTSPLRRARETCEACGYAAHARVEPLCMEWDYGDLNGLTREQIRETHGANWNIWDGPVPGGETLDQVAARARRVIDSLPASGESLIFAHGHFLRIFTAVYLDLPPATARNFALATARVSILGSDNGFPAIVRWNIGSDSA